MPSESADHDALGQAKPVEHAINASQDALAREKDHVDDDSSRNMHTPLPDSPTPVPGQKDKRLPAKGPKPFDQTEREEMENLLHELRGHLGAFFGSLRF